MPPDRCPICGAENAACTGDAGPVAEATAIRLVSKREDYMSDDVDRRLYWNADKSALVEADSPDAAFLAVAPGGPMDGDTRKAVAAYLKDRPSVSGSPADETAPATPDAEPEEAPSDVPATSEPVTDKAVTGPRQAKKANGS